MSSTASVTLTRIGGKVAHCPSNGLVKLDSARSGMSRPLSDGELFPARRFGAGPGGLGIDTVLSSGPPFGFLLGEEVPAQFDIVGFDPRGIECSSPVRCFSNLDRAFEFAPPVPFPLTVAEENFFSEAEMGTGQSVPAATAGPAGRFPHLDGQCGPGHGCDQSQYG